MSVSVRLAKYGKRHAPSYRVIVTKTRNKRSGKSIEILGHYNPSDPTSKFTIDKNKYEEWVNKGAIVSEAVKKLVEGTYEYIKYVPVQKESKKEKVAEETTEEKNTEQNSKEDVES